MFQAMYKWSMACMLSFTSFFLWPLPGSPPTVSMEAQGPGEIRIETQESQWTCSQAEEQFSLAAAQTITLHVESESGASIETLWIDDQKIEAAAGLESFEKQLLVEDDLKIQAAFAFLTEADSEDLTFSSQSTKGSLLFEDSGRTSDADGSEPGAKAERPEETQEKSQTKAENSNTIPPVFSALGQAISQWTMNTKEARTQDSDSDAASENFSQESFADRLSSGNSSSMEDGSASSQRSSPEPGDLSSQAESVLNPSIPRERLWENPLDEDAFIGILNEFRTCFYEVYDDYQAGSWDKWKTLRQRLAKAVGLEAALDEDAFYPASWFESNEPSQISSDIERLSEENGEVSDRVQLDEQAEDLASDGHSAIELNDSEADPAEESVDWIPEDSVLDLSMMEQKTLESSLETQKANEAIPGYAQVLNPNLVQPAPSRRMIRRAAAAGGVSGALKVTNVDLRSSVSIFGGYIGNYVWTLSNGCQAFCADYIKTAPKNGAVAKSISASNNMALRKALYYGFGGPNNLLANPANLNGAVYSQSQQIIITNDLISEAHSGTCVSKRDGLWSPGMENIYKLVQAQPAPPKEYKVYLCTFEGQAPNRAGNMSPYQPLAYAVMTPPEKADKGALQILKTDANPEISNAGKDNYSLSGAEFELVKGAAPQQGTFIRNLTIGADGASEVVEVDPGVYWVRETKAPKGYAASPDWHKIEVTADSSVEGPCRILVPNSPQYTTVDLFLRKINSFTGQSDARLAGARFKISYYAIDPADPGRVSQSSPVSSWTLQTDANGEIRAPGSRFPIGVITIQEVEAPEGFLIDDTVYTIPLDPKGSTQEIFQAFHPPVIRERPLTIDLLKKDESGSLALRGAQFKVTSPSGKTRIYTSDEHGLARLELPENGRWTIEEIKAPDGYSLNPTRITLHVSNSGIQCDAPASNGTIEWSGQSLLVKDLPQSYGIKLLKQNRKDQPLAGAVFGLYEDPKLTRLVSQVTTDTQGQAVFGNLAPGTSYYLSEISPPAGYQILPGINGQPKVFMIRATGGDTPSYFINGRIVNENPGSEAQGFCRLVMENEKTASIMLTIYNDQKETLPETGSSSALIVLGAGSGLILSGFARRKRHQEPKQQKN